MDAESLQIDIERKPTVEEAVALVAYLFPPGRYLISRVCSDEMIAKAAAGGGPEQQEPFESWFLEMLEQVSRERFVNAQVAIWDSLDRLLAARGLSKPSELDSFDLSRSLFDLTMGSTARMAGITIPADVQQRLEAIGFQVGEILDFPALAYRMGLLYDRLSNTEPVSFADLARLVRNAFPLSPAERIAVDFARNRAGMYLRPIFDASGNLWSAQREIQPLRELTARAIAERRSPLAVARELGNSNRAQGIVRDAQRVIRTEMANARGAANWQAMQERFGWTGDTFVFRRPSPHACKHCVRIYTENGQPRLYRVSEVEALDALGPNTGPGDEWVAKKGATHPNCVCPPWLEHVRGMFAVPAAA